MEPNNPNNENSLMQNMISLTMNVAFNILRVCSCCSIYINQMFKYMHDNSAVVRVIASKSRDCIYRVRSWCSSYRIERDGLWCGICNDHEGKYTENVLTLQSSDLQSNLLEKCIESINYKNMVKMLNPASKKKSIFMVRFEEKWICTVLDEHLDETPHIDAKKTHKHFMDISYEHPEMKSNIHIDLNSDLYVKDNQILSSAFVLRYLEYQPEPFVFDYNYKLNLMDDKLNMFELKPGQCIRLKTSKYEIEEVLSEETVKAGIPTYRKNI